jgi:hypothetical protein
MEMTRRNFTFSGLSAAVVTNRAFGASHDAFWNEKKPAEWSDLQIQHLMTHSPWAKETTVAVHMAGSDNGGRASSGRGRNRGGGGGGGIAEDGEMPSAGGRSGRGGGSSGGLSGPDSPAGRGPEIKVLVRWESAAPIRDALKSQLDPKVAGSYIISVFGLPVGAGQEMEERLKSATELQRKGRDPVSPVAIQFRNKPNGSLLLFMFPKDPQPIDLDDKEVVFVTKAGPVDLKVKFPLKEMIYNGRLEL